MGNSISVQQNRTVGNMHTATIPIRSGIISDLVFFHNGIGQAQIEPAASFRVIFRNNILSYGRGSVLNKNPAAESSGKFFIKAAPVFDGKSLQDRSGAFVTIKGDYRAVSPAVNDRGRHHRRVVRILALQGNVFPFKINILIIIYRRDDDSFTVYDL